MDLLEFVAGLLTSTDNKGCKTYIMFHGTTLQNALQIMMYGFVPSRSGMLGPGVYVSRSFQKASAYPKSLAPGEQQAILQLSVNVGRVKKIDYQGHPLQYTWHQAGYDTAWVPPNCGMVPSGLEEDCVWDPKNIQVLAILDKNGCPKNMSSYGSPMQGFPCPAPMMPYPYGMPGPPMMPFPNRMPPPCFFPSAMPSPFYPCPPAMPPPWWFL